MRGYSRAEQIKDPSTQTPGEHHTPAGTREIVQNIEPEIHPLGIELDHGVRFEWIRQPDQASDHAPGRSEHPTARGAGMLAASRS